VTLKKKKNEELRTHAEAETERAKFIPKLEPQEGDFHFKRHYSAFHDLGACEIAS
jgi:nicotinamidase-related amidase